MSPLRHEKLAVNLATSRAMRALYHAVQTGIVDDRTECPVCCNPIAEPHRMVSVQNSNHVHTGKVICLQCATPQVGMVAGTKTIKQGILV